MNEELLDRFSEDDFKAWLVMAGDREVGTAGYATDCPLARFLDDQLHSMFSVSSLGSCAQLLGGAELRQFVMPEWASKVIGLVDHLETVHYRWRGDELLRAIKEAES